MYRKIFTICLIVPTPPPPPCEQQSRPTNSMSNWNCAMLGLHLFLLVTTGHPLKHVEFRASQFRSKQQRHLLTTVSPSIDALCARGGARGRGACMCCSLGISQTCGGRERVTRVKPLRDMSRMPGVRIVTAKIKICQPEKCAYACVCMQTAERNWAYAEEWKNPDSRCAR